MSDAQPADYHDAFSAAIGNWYYFLTFLLPATVYLAPAVTRWRYIPWLFPIAFLASCVGYFVYWRSIDYALMDYYRRTGYFNTADTWYVFMPIFRGIPNALAATTGCTLIGWIVSRRGLLRRYMVTESAVSEDETVNYVQSDNPYEPPRSSYQAVGSPGTSTKH